jgi:hypothetical protein
MIIAILFVLLHHTGMDFLYGNGARGEMGIPSTSFSMKGTMIKS